MLFPRKSWSAYHPYKMLENAVFKEIYTPKYILHLIDKKILKY